MRTSFLAAAVLAALAVSSVALAAEPAVKLTGTDVVTGKRFSTAAYRGRPVVIVVWSSW